MGELVNQNVAKVGMAGVYNGKLYDLTVNAAGELIVAATVEIDSVEVSASALPTGAATAANQQTDALTNTELRAAAVETKETRSSSATTTTPTVTTSSASILAANADRTGGLISNPSGGSTVWINFGTTATTSHHELVAGAFLDLGTYTGSITAIIDTGTQDLVVTEFEE